MRLLTTPQLEQIVSFRKETGLDWQSVVRPYRLLVLDPSGDSGAVRLLSRRQPGTKVLYDGNEAVVLRQGA